MTSWTLPEFLAHLRSLDIRLGLDGERLTCSAPRGALSPELRAELQQRKSEILTFLASATQAAEAPAPPLLRADPGSIPVLSSGQRRLWFLDRMEPGNAMYNLPIALRMIGA